MGQSALYNIHPLFYGRVKTRQVSHWRKATTQDRKKRTALVTIFLHYWIQPKNALFLSNFGSLITIIYLSFWGVVGSKSKKANCHFSDKKKTAELGKPWRRKRSICWWHVTTGTGDKVTCKQLVGGGDRITGDINIITDWVTFRMQKALALL